MEQLDEENKQIQLPVLTTNGAPRMKVGIWAMEAISSKAMMANSSKVGLLAATLEQTMPLV